MTLREQLRANTQVHHQRLESRLGIMAIRSKNEYISLLQRFYGFYISIENRILMFTNQFRDINFELEPRLKASLIRRDLFGLGCSPDHIRDIPLCTDLPSLSTLAHAIGCLYVLEGSTLGGQMIARYFQETLQVTQGRGCGFFFGYGQNTGYMWQSFVSFLNAQGELIQNPIEVVRSACETFERLEQWMLP